jgi:hypothetical protein
MVTPSSGMRWICRLTLHWQSTRFGDATVGQVVNACEYDVHSPDGEIRWINTKGKMVVDAAGAPVRMLGVSIDVTERRRDEDRIRKSEARLAEAKALAVPLLASPRRFGAHPRPCGGPSRPASRGRSRQVRRRRIGVPTARAKQNAPRPTFGVPSTQCRLLCRRALPPSGA